MTLAVKRCQPVLNICRDMQSPTLHIHTEIMTSNSRKVGYLNEFLILRRCLTNHRLDLQISSLGDHFKSISAFPVYSLFRVQC